MFHTCWNGIRHKDRIKQNYYCYYDIYRIIGDRKQLQGFYIIESLTTKQKQLKFPGDTRIAHAENSQHYVRRQQLK